MRSYLIHRLGPLGAEVGAVVKQLEDQPDVTIQRALVLSLGEFGEKQWPPGEQNFVVQKLQENGHKVAEGRESANVAADECSHQ